MTKARMEAFSDAVYAIALTILVLELKIPTVEPNRLFQAALNQLPKLLAFILSFVIVGKYWVAHHSMLNLIKQVNHVSLWLNLLLLMFVCFIPYPAGILGEYPYSQFAIILYSISLSFVNIAGAIFWTYTTFKEENTIGISREFRKYVICIHLFPLIPYSLAVLFTFYSMTVSYILIVIVPILFIIPNRFIVRTPPPLP
ncbi:PF06736 family protein [Leptospira fainei serovar Hurstbridge str. BUT 6]|uniref:PF06736 family protein n=1 Tax=Leptospira fainei serovar Hurstbridge str. BUT 6 TaxID=1193011 RepID=S3UUU2_9LEPT|nr:TMEM175 family protein [Leptospira fainei]EPG73003.1 PF06736 family protein [Leptospira fainei serovar Hurstbridge str. BUT 6]